MVTLQGRLRLFVGCHRRHCVQPLHGTMHHRLSHLSSGFKMALTSLLSRLLKYHGLHPLKQILPPLPRVWKDVEAESGAHCPSVYRT